MSSDASSAPLPSDLSARFDHLLAACWRFTQSATRVAIPSELSPALEQSVLRLRPDDEWRAYRDDSRTYCAIGRTGDGGSHDPSKPLLQVLFLDGDATVYAAGAWYHDRERGWKVHNVHDIYPQISWRGFSSLLVH